MHAMYLGHGDGEAEIGKAMICIERQRDDTRANQGRCTCNTQDQGQQYYCRKRYARRLEAVALRAGWLYVDGGPRGDRSNATRIRSGFTRPIRPARDRDYLVKCGAQLASALEAAIRCLGEGFSNYIVNVWRDIWT